MTFEVCGEPIIGPEYLVPIYPIDNYIMPEPEELIIYDSPPNSGILNIHIPVEYGPCYIDSRRILLADFS